MACTQEPSSRSEAFRSDPGKMTSTAKTFPCENAPSSGTPIAACTDQLQARPLHDFASCLIIFTRTCFGKVTYLPFPVGPIIKVFEEKVDSWTHPFVNALEGHSLRTLAAVDDKIYAVGNSVERCTTTLRTVPMIFYSRGVIGLSADLWVQYEADLKESVQKAIDLASRFPLLNLITPVISEISAYLARIASEWLVKHSQIEEKGIQTSGENFSAQENVHEVDGKGFYLQIPSLVDDSFAGKQTTMSAGEGIEEIKELPSVDEPVDSHKEKVNLPDVPDLIDSGWLLGGALSSKETTSATKTFSSPKSSSSRVRKSIFKRW